MHWKKDQEFEYIPLKVNFNDYWENKPITITWNLDGDDVEITGMYFEENIYYDYDKLYDMDIDLAEDIMSYIEEEFLHSEDFWMTKMGYDF